MTETGICSSKNAQTLEGGEQKMRWRYGFPVVEMILGSRKPGEQKHTVLVYDGHGEHLHFDHLAARTIQWIRGKFTGKPHI